jgi:hypothetical protein
MNTFKGLQVTNDDTASLRLILIGYGNLYIAKANVVIIDDATASIVFLSHPTTILAPRWLQIASWADIM